jgi:methylmalonyl-CoA mutase cobalamin-binding domain/chain
MPSSLVGDIARLEKEKVLEELKKRLEQGEDPLKLINECSQGMILVGERYQRGEYFLAELILSAEIFRQATEILEPYLTKVRPPKPRGTIVLATLKGDIHDLGKNIFAILLRARGFEVYDLGVDVEPTYVVEKIKEIKPDFVGFSALLTTTFDYIKETIELLKKEGLRNHFRILVGGGITTPMVKNYVGADFQTRDAIEGVTYCLKFTKGKE